MMDVRAAYNQWAAVYDGNENKTRDLEGQALMKKLSRIGFGSCLEIGCGTGKNTAWLMNKARQVIAVDFSEEMLAKAQEKIQSPRVEFVRADILEPWHFLRERVDLITFSLVLEHVPSLEPVFAHAAQMLKAGGHLYLGELHPFKQYTGSKARFDLGPEQHVLPCYTHHVTDFLQAGLAAGLILEDLDEFFDDDQRSGMPRILTLVFRKN